MSAFANTDRRFRFERDVDVSGVSGVGVVATGILFADGQAVVRWIVADKPQSTVVYATLADAVLIHGHDGKTRLVFEDVLDDAAPAPFAQAIPLGTEFEVGDRTMLPTRYAVHSAMMQQEGVPAAPMILVDLDGLTDAGNASLRLLIPEPLAIAIRDAVNVSLKQLENVRRGRPAGS